jgi:hypothetical protein
MNYEDIKTLSLSYADRQDAEVVNNFDNFLRIVESRVNQRLKVQKMTCRATITSNSGTNYYGLPDDFMGLRDIELYDAGDPTKKTTLQYLNPEQMNNASGNKDDCVYYNISADQLHIVPAQDNKVIEILYYQKVPSLTEDTPSNWLAEDHPDVYVFGALVEISSFVKDAQAKMLWDERYQEAIAGLDYNDEQTRWSGTTLQVRMG